MYRESDSICDTEDSAPSEEKNVPFRPRYDCLDERSTEMVFFSFFFVNIYLCKLTCNDKTI